MIERRYFTRLLLAAPFAATACSVRTAEGPVAERRGFSYLPGIATREPLIAPPGRAIKVAFAINPGVQVIDLAGPWETFQMEYAGLVWRP